MLNIYCHFRKETRILSDTTFKICLETAEGIFESVDEILWCDHSNETSSAVLLHGTICFSIFYKMKFGIFIEFGFLALLEV